MLIKEKYKILVSNRNKKYLISKGYNCDNKYEMVDVMDISNGSSINVGVKCDYCDNVKNISKKNYQSTINKNDGLYFCSKCWGKRISKLMINKYGVSSALKNENIKEKQKNTMYERYGVYHPSESKEIIVE